MTGEFRKTGISVVGDVPWGTHFCHFYHTKDDLLDILIPYFQVGLKNNEFCMWIVFDPLTEEAAREALRTSIPGGERHLKAGDVEVVAHTQWYLVGGAFDVQRVIDGWQEKLAQALSRGYDGMRVNGNEGWLTEKDWKVFSEYETKLGELIVNRRMIVLCTYPLGGTTAAELLDVARKHQFAVARRQGNWEVLETPELKQAKTEIKKLNEELERRIAERTRELAENNEQLRREIASRQKAEEALRQSEEKYHLVVDKAQEGIVIAQDGLIRFANPKALEIAARSEQELFSVPFTEFIHPDDREMVYSHHMRRLRGEQFQERYAIRIVRGDGTEKWVEIDGTTISWQGGLGALVFLTDITDRKRADEERIRLVTAIEQAAEAVVITDAEGSILYANPSFEQITGYSRQEALGNNPRILKSGRHDDEFYKHMWETISGGAVWKGRMTNKKKDGALFEEEGTISPIRDGSGIIVNYVAVKRDVTREVSLQAQLLQAHKMEAVGTLAGGIAHDFNNLLTIVMGFSELLLAEKEQGDREYADLQKIFRAARNGADLVQRLLMFSRKSEPKPVPMNLNKQIVQVEKLLRRTIPKMIEIRLDLSPDVPDINADPSQIEQVLMNLSLNARDAMGDAGKLTVKTDMVRLDDDYCRLHIEARPGEHVLLAVSDTGHGMDKETAEHIFEPFFTTKEMGRGTGLGLAMVYGIVKQHDGHITVHSEVGKGATFKVYLPAIPAKREIAVADSGIMPAFGTETVLLVDDEEFVRELGTRVLTKHGYTVLQAANGRDAIELFKRERSRISLVILDLIMPEMGGMECLRELLKIDPGVKVLIASGYSADASVRETLQLGAKGFVIKPFRFKELLIDVRRALDEG